MKGVSIMEPRKQKPELEQTQEPRPEEKPRRFRLVRLEERRFRMDRLEDRIAPLSGITDGTYSVAHHTACFCHHH
jgi:hypothetical protein